MHTEMLHVRVDKKAKAEAAKALKSIGISMSDVVRIVLNRIAVERALPFEVCIPHIPNAKTAKVLRDAKKGKGLGPRQTLEEHLAEMRADVE